jgi:hypothetical protein
MRLLCCAGFIPTPSCQCTITCSSETAEPWHPPTVHAPLAERTLSRNVSGCISCGCHPCRLLWQLLYAAPWSAMFCCPYMVCLLLYLCCVACTGAWPLTCAFAAAELGGCHMGGPPGGRAAGPAPHVMVPSCPAPAAVSRTTCGSEHFGQSAPEAAWCGRSSSKPLHQAARNARRSRTRHQQQQQQHWRRRQCRGELQQRQQRQQGGSQHLGCLQAAAPNSSSRDMQLQQAGGCVLGQLPGNRRCQCSCRRPSGCQYTSGQLSLSRQLHVRAMQTSCHGLSLQRQQPLGG